MRLVRTPLVRRTCSATSSPSSRVSIDIGGLFDLGSSPSRWFSLESEREYDGPGVNDAAPNAVPPPPSPSPPSPPPLSLPSPCCSSAWRRSRSAARVDSTASRSHTSLLPAEEEVPRVVRGERVVAVVGGGGEPSRGSGDVAASPPTRAPPARGTYRRRCPRGRAPWPPLRSISERASGSAPRSAFLSSLQPGGGRTAEVRKTGEGAAGGAGGERRGR